MPVTHYIWDEVNDCCLMETDEIGVPSVVYSQEPSKYGGIISQRRGTETQFFHNDAIGNTTLLTDESGVVTDSYEYDAWGNQTSTVGATLNPFRWMGRVGYYCDSEIIGHYIRRRTYSQLESRWRSQDPRELDGIRNLYLAFRNNPLTHSDPSGEVPIDVTGPNTEQCSGGTLSLEKGTPQYVPRGGMIWPDVPDFRIIESWCVPTRVSAVFKSNCCACCSQFRIGMYDATYYGIKQQWFPRPPYSPFKTIEKIRTVHQAWINDEKPGLCRPGTPQNANEPCKTALSDKSSWGNLGYLGCRRRN